MLTYRRCIKVSRTKGLRTSKSEYSSTIRLMSEWSDISTRHEITIGDEEESEVHALRT